jgi:hypothetical protein
LVKLDWENKHVIKKVSAAPKTITIDDPDLRANSRGGRGVVNAGGKVILASYCELQVYDLDLNHLYNYSHPLMVGLHEIHKVSERYLWLASTTLDCSLLFDLETSEVVDSFWPREMPEFQMRWNLFPLELDKNEDQRLRFIGKYEGRNPNHIHLNALSVWNDDVYALINRFGAIINLTKRTVLFEDRSVWGGHNLRFLEDGTAIFNDTRNQGIYFIDRQGSLIKRLDLIPFHPIGKKIPSYRRLNTIRKILERLKLNRQPTILPFYVRGLDIDGDILFVGISPAAILCIDWKKEKLIDLFDYSSDLRVSVHGLRIYNS